MPLAIFRPFSSNLVPDVPSEIREHVASQGFVNRVFGQESQAVQQIPVVVWLYPPSLTLERIAGTRLIEV